MQVGVSEQEMAGRMQVGGLQAQRGGSAGRGDQHPCKTQLFQSAADTATTLLPAAAAAAHPCCTPNKHLQELVTLLPDLSSMLFSLHPSTLAQLTADTAGLAQKLVGGFSGGGDRGGSEGEGVCVTGGGVPCMLAYLCFPSTSRVYVCEEGGCTCSGMTALCLLPPAAAAAGPAAGMVPHCRLGGNGQPAPDTAAGRALGACECGLSFCFFVSGGGEGVGGWGGLRVHWGRGLQACECVTNKACGGGEGAGGI